MTAGLFAVLIGLIALPLLVFYVWVLVDVLRTPGTVWAAADQSQVVWAVVVVFLSLLGAILYMIIARPRLLAAKGSHGA